MKKAKEEVGRIENEVKKRDGYVLYLMNGVPIMKFLILQKTHYFKAHLNQSCEVSFSPVFKVV